MDQEEWSRFHRIILRATHEKASERYLRFEAFAEELSESYAEGAKEAPQSSLWRRSGILWKTVRALGLCAALAVCANFWHLYSSSKDYEKKLTLCADEFEVLLRQARKDVEKAPEQENIQAFKALATQLAAQEGDSLDGIKQLLSKAEALKPSVLKELNSQNLDTMHQYRNKLYEAACRPDDLAKNAVEHFQARRLIEALLKKADGFGDQATEWLSRKIDDHLELADLIPSALSKINDAHAKKVREMSSKLASQEEAIRVDIRSCDKRQGKLRADINQKKATAPQDTDSISALEHEISRIDEEVYSKYKQLEELGIAKQKVEMAQITEWDHEFFKIESLGIKISGEIGEY